MRATTATVRLATPAERSTVAALMAACGLAPEDAPTPAPATALLVAELDGRLVGAVGLEFGPQGACLVRNLCVLPEARHQGLGSRLLETAMEVARRRECDRLYLFTSDVGPLYRRLGFREVGVPELAAALPSSPMVRQLDGRAEAPEAAWRFEL